MGWGKSQVPFFGPRARGWPDCCRQERGNLERFPLRICQIIQGRSSVNRACAGLTRMRCPLLPPRDKGLSPGPCQSGPVLRGPGVHGEDTSKPPCLSDLAWLGFLAFWAHTSGAHTHPTTATCTKYPRSLSRPGDSYAPFNTLLELLSTALPDCPISGPLLPHGGSCYSILCLPNRNGALPTCLAPSGI